MSDGTCYTHVFSLLHTTSIRAAFLQMGAWTALSELAPLPVETGQAKLGSNRAASCQDSTALLQHDLTIVPEYVAGGRNTKASST